MLSFVTVLIFPTAVFCLASNESGYSLNSSTENISKHELNQSAPLDATCQFNSVKRVNASELLAVISEDKAQGKNGSIFFANFYSLNCPFSKKLAPIYSALPSAYPSVRFFKFNAAKEPHLNLRYGVFGYPSIIMFRNGYAAKRYDGPYNSTELERFVYETSFVPPLSSFARSPPAPYIDDEEKEKDLFLYFSIVVTIILPVELLYRRFCSRA